MGFFHLVRSYVAGKELDDRNSSETLGGGGGGGGGILLILK